MIFTNSFHWDEADESRLSRSGFFQNLGELAPGSLSLSPLLLLPPWDWVGFEAMGLRLGYSEVILGERKWATLNLHSPTSNSHFHTPGRYEPRKNPHFPPHAQRHAQRGTRKISKWSMSIYVTLACGPVGKHEA